MRITTRDKVLTEDDSASPSVAPPTTDDSAENDEKSKVVVVLREGQDEEDIANGTSYSLTLGLLGYVLALPLAVLIVLGLVYLL